MLFNILRLIQQGTVHNLQELAQTLNVNTTLITQMTQQLTQQGYLASAQSGCAGGCGGCGHQPACALSPALHLWTLTKKGEAALRKR